MAKSPATTKSPAPKAAASAAAPGASTPASTRAIPTEVTDKAWLKSFIASLEGTKDGKVFFAADLEGKRALALAAYQAFCAQVKTPGKRVYKKTEEVAERVAIEMQDGTIGEVETLPDHEGKGPASASTPRGQMLARKRQDAMMVGGTVVRILRDRLG